MTGIFMDKETLKSFHSWFENYVQSFHSNEPKYQQNIDIKIEHTRRVCREIDGIGQTLNLSDDDLRLAEAIALFHDIGRFEQYKRYRTYADLLSENHATLGVSILRNHRILSALDDSASDLIFRTISLHNRIEIPADEPKRVWFFCRLLRDADKLDIWRVVTEYYHNPEGEKNETIELGLPDTNEISDEVLINVLAEKKVQSTDLKSLNDFKLMQMGWIYDVNFPRTFQLIRARRYMELIYDTLPPSDHMDQLYSQIRSFLDKRIQMNNFNAQ